MLSLLKKRRIALPDVFRAQVLRSRVGSPWCLAVIAG
jgi:DNA-binding transcriptional regulator/RsmH inhibitor MraZ